ncbi:hypothetical protein FQZ97_1175030 [compost metagenome]
MWLAILDPASKRLCGLDELQTMRLHVIGQHVATLGTAGHANPSTTWHVDAHRVAATVEGAGCRFPLARPGQLQAFAFKVAHRIGQSFALECHAAPT